MSIPVKTDIASKIIFLRREKVMLDRDLARLYGVETRVLKQAVKRNIERFPEDFMFEFTREELDNWRSQIVISNSDKMGLRYKPMAFTEQGIAMLSSVLKSKRAIDVNIQIMRAFVRMRRIISENKELADKLDKLEKRMDKTDGNVEVIFTAIRQLMAPPETPKRKIGFTAGNRKKGIKAF